MAARKEVKLAAFDIDGTIFRSHLFIELIRAFVREGVFPKTAQKEVEIEYTAWLNRTGSFVDYNNKLIEIYLRYIKNKTYASVFNVAKKVVAIYKDRDYVYTRNLIKDLKKKGYYILAISGSPNFIVKQYADYKGFDTYYGTVLEVQKGKFTGRIFSEDTYLNKDKVLEDFISWSKLPVNLSKSIGVGDTESDIPMLKLVGQPIAFNPNRALADYAKTHGWPIVVERKDVIYELKNYIFK
ncbi:MAG: HAD-IB family hydrolase [Candidatus Buchananbacteria bacterium CG10_big_fil_rev_8_21_14_0_10_42_9]|uniref:HAD-IB family hydrolase n=1 Tax=Candidatus Buchananbacteria bacterium CG10_big_fil_rev_8_21_14_0_10_42_9 TaxID=1974526 RepID=A0A2H0W2D1_9BACT|nr:MAG: HAD-IB family hydrolase [Candidatus Buchananbacteria bacterium CG10_big_fil_rev_8_21_14_0_10_42_9]